MVLDEERPQLPQRTK